MKVPVQCVFLILVAVASPVWAESDSTVGAASVSEPTAAPDGLNASVSESPKPETVFAKDIKVFNSRGLVVDRRTGKTYLLELLSSEKSVSPLEIASGRYSFKRHVETWVYIPKIRHAIPLYEFQDLYTLALREFESARDEFLDARQKFEEASLKDTTDWNTLKTFGGGLYEALKHGQVSPMMMPTIYPYLSDATLVKLKAEVKMSEATRRFEQKIRFLEALGVTPPWSQKYVEAGKATALSFDQLNEAKQLQHLKYAVVTADTLPLSLAVTSLSSALYGAEGLYLLKGLFAEGVTGLGLYSILSSKSPTVRDPFEGKRVAVLVGPEARKGANANPAPADQKLVYRANVGAAQRRPQSKCHVLEHPSFYHSNIYRCIDLYLGQDQSSESRWIHKDVMRMIREFGFGANEEGTISSRGTGATFKEVADRITQANEPGNELILKAKSLPKVGFEAVSPNIEMMEQIRGPRISALPVSCQELFKRNHGSLPKAIDYLLSTYRVEQRLFKIPPGEDPKELEQFKFYQKLKKLPDLKFKERLEGESGYDLRGYLKGN